MQSLNPTISSLQTSFYLNGSSTKILGSIVVAAMITFSIFVVMQKLIHQDYIAIVEPGSVIIPNVFLADDLDSPIKTTQDLPEKPKMMEQPKPVDLQPQSPDELAITDEFTFERPALAINKIAAVFTTGGNDARPIVRIQPKYPIDAARDGTEGWVQLEFTIDSSGTVKDVQVTDSEPKRVFDSEAKRALRKWKYKPQIVDGRAVDLPNMQVVLDFKLNS